ncbi:MAG: alpha-amylase family glycosyl hydrolase, partial [Eubacteriales bacterium]|nr:alpha-amylase family glycosyl hydrolase [Eubacteriales bacterium]
MKYEAITAPEWLARNAIYQINPRTFSPEGTIAAVTKELPALKELGFRIMYLCPIFEEDDSEVQAFWSERQKKSGTLNPKNPYRMNDYFTVDSEYGTMEDLRAFIAEVHRLGMRVLLDLVYLHIGPNAPILKRHPEFAKQDQNGNIILTSWHFPYLDYTCPGLREYLWCNMVYYVGELDVDGFRCDVGDGVPLDFWNEGRRRMQAIKPDSI